MWGDEMGGPVYNQLAYEKFVEMAVRAFGAEESRLDSARTRAATVIGASSIVAGLEMAGVQWSLDRVAPGIFFWTWLGALLTGAAFLLASVALAMHVLLPKKVFSPTEPMTYLRLVYSRSDLIVLRVLGEAYTRTVEKNSEVVDRLLTRLQWSGWLLFAGLIANGIQIAVAVVN